MTKTHTVKHAPPKPGPTKSSPPKRRVLQPKVFLPLIMVFGFLAIGGHVGHIWESVTTGRLFAAVAAPAPSPPATPAAKDAPEKTGTPPTQPVSSTAPPSSQNVPPPSTEERTSNEMDLVKELSNRRDQLDGRSRTLDTREALIRVAEQRVDQKIKEMETLRAQLQTMVNQASAAQQAQLDNLVKIYETMKPKEAARIFGTLELPVLLGVIQKMKPQRTAAVMAELPPEKAKEITIALTRQDQLPQIK